MHPSLAYMTLGVPDQVESYGKIFRKNLLMYYTINMIGIGKLSKYHKIE